MMAGLKTNNLCRLAYYFVWALVLFAISIEMAQAQNQVATEPGRKNPIYVFLFIGDGMGMTQRYSAESYLGAIKNPSNPNLVKLATSGFPVLGMCTTYDLTSICPDSASTGTAIASGHKTTSGTLAMDPTGKIPYKSIATMAKEKGMKVGIVSSVSIDHATPAVFYANQPTRSNHYDIAIQLGKSGFDYFGGGGFLSPTGSNNDKPDAYEAAKKNGYVIVNNKNDFQALKPTGNKVYAYEAALDSQKALYYDIDRSSDMISLAEFTKKGIELLDNPNGFFMMVEGGKIDWTNHANDARTSINDTIALDNAVREAITFYNQHQDDTLIIVTADHETGGMTIGWAGTRYVTFYQTLGGPTMSFDAFNTTYVAGYRKNGWKVTDQQLMADIRKAFGLDVDKLDAWQVKMIQDALAASKAKAESKDTSRDRSANKAKSAATDKDADSHRAPIDQTYVLYGGYEPLTVTLIHILNNNAGIGWTSYSHTGLPVPVFARGPQSNQFSGFYDDTDIAKKLINIMGL
ncbi:MAG: alkaline phosphatase [Deltaproteobacteria bacterium]|nr:alkaline phosphatase [Deltaproteobacteria bacterium]